MPAHVAFKCHDCGAEQERYPNASRCSKKGCKGRLQRCWPGMPPPPDWVQGRPTGVGLWLVQTTNEDYVAALVEKTEYVGHDGEYLAVIVDGDSEELKNCEWAARSYGPIPVPKEST
jgi:hypothetical protein